MLTGKKIRLLPTPEQERLFWRSAGTARWAYNYLHQITNEIVKTKPFRIVMETLNVKGMLKNRHLAKEVAQQKFYELKRLLEYKCKKHGIAFVQADKWFPSSKKCSCCGSIKKNLKLSDRIYQCG